MKIVLPVTLLFLIILVSTSLTAEERHALVIGNSQYMNSPLQNPRNDALDVAAELKKLGYRIHKNRALLDLDREGIEQELLNYALSLPSKAISLFYYAGHGIATSTDNYLIPIGSDLKYREQLPQRAVSLRASIELINNYNSDGFNITLLDACRDNPLARQSDRSVKNGLNRLGNLPRGNFIGYAADNGQVAKDGFGRNGVYTKELLHSLRVNPDKPIESVHKEIATRVVKKTNSDQFPVSEQKFIGTYCFGECGVNVGKTTQPPTARQESTKPEKEKMSALKKSLYVVGTIALLGLANSLAKGDDGKENSPLVIELPE